MYIDIDNNPESYIDTLEQLKFNLMNSKHQDIDNIKHEYIEHIDEQINYASNENVLTIAVDFNINKLQEVYQQLCTDIMNYIKIKDLGCFKPEYESTQEVHIINLMGKYFVGQYLVKSKSKSKSKSSLHFHPMLKHSIKVWSNYFEVNEKQVIKTLSLPQGDLQLFSHWVTETETETDTGTLLAHAMVFDSILMSSTGPSGVSVNVLNESNHRIIIVNSKFIPILTKVCIIYNCDYNTVVNNFNISESIDEHMYQGYINVMYHQQ